MSMQGKRPSDSAVIMTQTMLPQDANPSGNVHGGVVLKYIDTAGGAVAMRHCRSNAVTASIDRMSFLRPVFVGEMVTFKASINMVGSSSMEVGVRVEAENLFTGEVRHTSSAYLTYVSLDENHRPKSVPPLLLETDEEKRRNKEALARREMRRIEREREKAAEEQRK